jgi:hypothetical protein
VSLALVPGVHTVVDEGKTLWRRRSVASNPERA